MLQYDGAVWINDKSYVEKEVRPVGMPCFSLSDNEYAILLGENT
jgi:hypothetical protein